MNIPQWVLISLYLAPIIALVIMVERAERRAIASRRKEVEDSVKRAEAAKGLPSLPSDWKPEAETWKEATNSWKQAAIKEQELRVLERDLRYTKYLSTMRGAVLKRLSKTGHAKQVAEATHHVTQVDQTWMDL